MANAGISLNTIENLLALKRMVIVGLSRDAKDFSVMLFNELCRRGYDVMPVNPNATEIMGRQCFPSVRAIQPPVDWALLMTSPITTEAVVHDCAEAGVRKIWLYRAGSTGGAVSADAVEFCRTHGIEVVPGACPYMFFPKNGFHKVHGWIEKIAGWYPKREKAA